VTLDDAGEGGGADEGGRGGDGGDGPVLRVWTGACHSFIGYCYPLGRD
jgi:hypothetical protein